MMTVNEVSKLTGVSIRTLQYYDTIGLLKPIEYTESGYRLYDDTALERLQQILLFKELEFSLKEIKEIVDAPNFDREKALEIFKSEVGKKKFTPSDFMSERTLEKMSGLYVPFWLADCRTTAAMSGTGKNIRTWTQGKYQYTETKEHAVERRASIVCRGVPADGASKIDDDLMDATEPFDYGRMKDFSMSYLSGFLADRYDVDKGEVFPRIRGKVEAASKSLLNESVSGYSSFSAENTNINISGTE